MSARRSQAAFGLALIVCLAVILPEAGASPARRLARRGILLAPPPGTAIVPPAGPLRPNPLLAVPIAPGGPSVVIGPAGRVRRRLTLPPGAVPAPVPAAVVTITESVTAMAPSSVAMPAEAAAVAPAASVPPVATRPAPSHAAVKSPGPVPAAVAAEPIPTPPAATLPAPAGGVVPAGGELEIPDGTQSILVQPAGGTPPASNRP